MYKIFFNRNVILLNYDASGDKGCTYVFDFAEIESRLYKFLDGVRTNEETVCLRCHFEKCKEDFWSKFKVIKAAGGIVGNSKGEVLLIKRNGVWDLPKGKVEPGEQTADAAVREVSEECGIDNIVADKLFDTTYHIYDTYGFWALKETYWFLMNSDDTNFVPQTEEGIEEVRWADKEFVKEVKSNMYPLVFELLSNYFDR